MARDREDGGREGERERINKEPDRSHISFYVLALQVMHHHPCQIIFIKAVNSQPRFMGETHTPLLDGGVSTLNFKESV